MQQNRNDKQSDDIVKRRVCNIQSIIVMQVISIKQNCKTNFGFMLLYLLVGQLIYQIKPLNE